jgi:nicotinamide mononucleotide transporter PnuC
VAKIKSLLRYFSKTEIILWCSSVILVVLSFCIFDRENNLTLCASLIGVTSLIFNAKGNPFGQVLMVLFSLLYGIISFSFAYYGEIITYLGMTMPMAICALVSWLRNPYQGNKAEVKVNAIGRTEIFFMWVFTAVVTVLFYFILDAFDTANILPSTLSVTTSFIAVYLTFRRSQYFAIAYAMNDIILIALWILASLEDSSYISVCICFVTFLFNDIYGFIAWNRMHKRQSTKNSRICFRLPGKWHSLGIFLIWKPPVWILQPCRLLQRKKKIHPRKSA